MEIKKLIGKRIQQIRKNKSITQEKLAEIIGIEVPSMSNLETGKYAPSIETLQKLSQALGVKLWEFYYFDDISKTEMKTEIIKTIEGNEKLLKTVYYFCKSLEY